MATCPHDPNLTPASCVECMFDGPVGPPVDRPDVSDAEVVAWVTASYNGRCAANPDHTVDKGDRIGLVADVGWCCTRCAPEPDPGP